MTEENKAHIHAIVIIPAYEPPETFYTYAAQVASEADAFLVVNDGSDSRFDPIFQKIAKLPHTKVISYPENHGKGYALKTAFHYCAEHYDKNDILVTADCDGQHMIRDVGRVAECAAAHPDALVLGARDFDHPNVPKRSRSGNLKMRWMYRLFYGLNLADTQTGLRACTVATAERFLAVRGDRFEFESAMLIFAMRRQIPVLEEPIETVYPADPKEHVSHFRTLRDSLRVLSVMLGNLFDFIGVAVISAVADVLVFLFFLYVVFPEESPLYSLIATIAARVFSSVLNFLLNCKTVFYGRVKRAVFRYYFLWVCQLAASYGILYLFHYLLFLPQAPVKLIGDLTLSILSYQIQCRWVYRRREGDTSVAHQPLWGPLARLVRFVLRLFRPRYRCDFSPETEPTLYVCRHLNMHGPLVTLTMLPKQVRPMVLSVFFDRKSCERQYATYTFTVRKGKKPRKHSFKAGIAAIGASALVRSLRSVPVYRGSAESVRTFRLATSALASGDSVIVYPDVDYKNENGQREIYTGFLYIGELYRRKTGKSLPIVPLFIDERQRVIREFPPVYVDSFREDSVRASEAVTAGIYG